MSVDIRVRLMMQDVYKLNAKEKSVKIITGLMTEDEVTGDATVIVTSKRDLDEMSYEDVLSAIYPKGSIATEKRIEEHHEDNRIQQMNRGEEFMTDVYESSKDVLKEESSRVLKEGAKTLGKLACNVIKAVI